MPSFDTTITEWLAALRIRVSSYYFRELLQTHPDYPSLLSITDTLNQLNIEHAAIQIEKEQLLEVPVPFLAHIQGNGGEWVMINNRDKLDTQFPHFFDRWNGIVLAAEKTAGWRNKENEKWIRKEQKNKQLIIAIFGILSALILTGLLYAGNFLLTGLVFLIAAGIFISWLIVTKDLGIENKLADQVCGTIADCNTVMQSGAAKLPGGITWGDIGISWFSFQLLIISVGPFTAFTVQLNNLLSLFAVFYIPFIIFSVFYQWRIAKKWCRLCLLVAGILLIQDALFLPQWITGNLTMPNLPTMLLAVLLLGSTFIGLLTIKNLLKKNRVLQTTNWTLKRFKNNPDIAIAQLTKERKVDIIPWEHDLQLGNPDANLQLLVACNPYCGPCASAHKTLHGLIEADKELGLTVRFTVNAANKEDKKTQAVEYLFQLIAEKEQEPGEERLIIYKRELLHDWFEWMDTKKFETQHRLKMKTNVTKLVELQEQWTKEAAIQATPTLFVNGYELPKTYSISDLPGLLSGLKTVLQEKTIQPAGMLVV